jgi:hypothetical protein
MRSDEVITGGGLFCYFNADETNTNYYSQRFYTYNSAVGDQAAAEPFIGIIPGASTTASSYINFKARVGSYEGSQLKSIRATSAGNITTGTTMFTSEDYVQHDTMVAPLTRIRFRCTTGIHGTMRMYGRKNRVMNSISSSEVVQKVTFDGAGVVQYSTESGWSAVISSVGNWVITYPTTAPSILAQHIVVTPMVLASTSLAWAATPHNLTTTGCDIVIESTSSTEADLPICITRTLG